MLRDRTILVFVVWLTATAAAAQDAGSTPVLTLVPNNPSRWDAAANVTWLGERRLDRPFDSDRWYEVAAGGAAIGYYWSSHLKTELDVWTSTEGESYSFHPVPVPSSPAPWFVQRDHRFHVTTMSAGLNRQFFENAWFHPFVGAGVELLREEERVTTTVPIVSARDPRTPVSIPTVETEQRVRYAARPFLAGGFKAYVSERAFIRTDLRTSWSGDGVTALAWRGGVGVDF